MIRPEQIIGRRLGEEPKDACEHFYVYKQCGQAVDKRDAGQVIHHEKPDHHPLQ